MTSLRARRLAAWIAMFAMALTALAPTVSRALARGAAGPVAWTEVCTASGKQWINLDTAAITGSTASTVAGEPGGRQPAHNPLDHCPFCLLAAERLGPATDTVAHFFAPGNPVAPAIGLLPAFRSLISLAAHARGPPLNTSPLSVA
ncbi:MAG: DUF2946 domain-containing protein [Burkholderiaceae bacterium]|nr:DUF2946 domain-containing protein [Burkholderiaceae bacterium]